MNRKSMLRWLAALAMLDGLALLLGGRIYARVWAALPGPGLYHRPLARFAMLPGWVLRLAGLAEMALGLATPGRSNLLAENLRPPAAPAVDREPEQINSTGGSGSSRRSGMRANQSGTLDSRSGHGGLT